MTTKIDKYKTLDDYFSLLNTKEYNFLNDFKQKHHISYLTLGGSRAYGTNNENSDVDIRGFFMESRADLLGIKSYNDVFVEEKTDTTLYSYKKFISLICKCNPNVIELLGTLPEHRLYLDYIALNTINNKSLFLSKLAYQSFSGYATAQLRRLENALARDTYTQPEKEKHIQKSIESEILQLNNSFKNFDESSKFHLYILKSEKEDLDDEIYVDVSANGIPLRDYLKRNSNIANTIHNYGKLNKRNHKKDELHLNKHAMHLIRLYMTGLDILKNNEIKTFRDGDEHTLLMSIRNGEVPYKDIFKLAKEYAKRLDSAYNFSKLPNTPDYDAVNDFVIKQFDFVNRNRKK